MKARAKANQQCGQRGVLALRIKPIIEARARAKHLANAGDKVSEAARENSHTPVEKIRTDESVAGLANISSNTIRKIERIEGIAEPQVKAWAT